MINRSYVLKLCSWKDAHHQAAHGVLRPQVFTSISWKALQSGIQVSLGRNYLFVPTDLDLCPCRALMVVMILVRFVVMMIIWRLGLPDRRGHGRVESKSHNWVSTFYHFFVFLRHHQCECTNPVLCELEPIKIIRNLALRENGRKIATWNKYITISGTIFNIITVIIKITMAIATTRRLRSFPSGI